MAGGDKAGVPWADVATVGVADGMLAIRYRARRGPTTVSHPYGETPNARTLVRLVDERAQGA